MIQDTLQIVPSKPNLRSRLAKVGHALLKAYEFPARRSADLVSKTLEHHWGKTYTAVGLASTAFVVLATFGIQPELKLPTWIIGILSPIILGEYLLFLSLIHKKTLEIYGTCPCKTRLAILRVTKTRPLTYLGLVATAFLLAALGFLNISYPLLAAFPYYVAANISYLTRFRIPKDKELQTAFDALEELPSLSNFYQSFVLGIIDDRVEKTVRKNVPLAKNVVANPLLRALYVGYCIPGQGSAMKGEVAKLKEAISSEAHDIFESIEKISQMIPDTYRSANLSFQLPWESKINWGLAFTIIFGLIDAFGTILILQNAGVFSAALKIILGL